MPHNESPIASLECSECKKAFPLDGELLLCPICEAKNSPETPPHGLLDVITPSPSRSNDAPANWLPVERTFLPDLPAGGTPMWRSHRLNEQIPHHKLWLKNEGSNPTGSLKDRASLLVAAWAKKLKKSQVFVASTGNAASSMAGVGAAAGLSVKVFVPQSAPKTKIAQCQAYGAEVETVDGSYDDALVLSREFALRSSAMCRNTGINPLTVEGKKTVSIEMFQQLGEVSPDYVFVPTGDGVILCGVYKGFADLQKAGFLERIPKIIAVQATGSNAIARAFSSGHFETPTVPASTRADSLAVSVPQAGRRALAYLRAFDGDCVQVSDDQIFQAQADLAKRAGLFVEPAAAAAFAGYLASAESIPTNAAIVILNTGNGLKDPLSLSATQTP